MRRLWLVIGGDLELGGSKARPSAFKYYVCLANSALVAIAGEECLDRLLPRHRLSRAPDGTLYVPSLLGRSSLLLISY